jgi:hypothetical protein
MGTKEKAAARGIRNGEVHPRPASRRRHGDAFGVQTPSPKVKRVSWFGTSHRRTVLSYLARLLEARINKGRIRQKIEELANGRECRDAWFATLPKIPMVPEPGAARFERQTTASQETRISDAAGRRDNAPCKVLDVFDGISPVLGK